MPLAPKTIATASTLYRGPVELQAFIGGLLHLYTTDMIELLLRIRPRSPTAETLPTVKGCHKTLRISVTL